MVSVDEFPNARWLPSADRLIAAALDLAKCSPGDRVIDLGSGDGKVLAAIAERGAHAIGLEIDPELNRRAEARTASLAPRPQVLLGDLYQTDLRLYDPDIVVAYLTPATLQRLAPRLRELKTGTRIVTIDMSIPGWSHDEREQSCYLYRVPARRQVVAEPFRWPHRGLEVRIPPDRPTYVSLTANHPPGEICIASRVVAGASIAVRTGVSFLEQPGPVAVDFDVAAQPAGSVHVTLVHSPVLGELLVAATVDANCSAVEVRSIGPERLQQIRESSDLVVGS